MKESTKYLVYATSKVDADIFPTYPGYPLKECTTLSGAKRSGAAMLKHGANTVFIERIDTFTEYQVEKVVFVLKNGFTSTHKAG